MDVRQSPQYAQYLKSLGWQVEKLDQWHVFIRRFPIIGSLIKIQRIEPPVSFTKIEGLAQKYRAFQIILEPASQLPQLLKGYKPLKSPFIPTKTLILDLNQSREKIFNSFSKNKRRDIRLAERGKIVVKEGAIEDFTKLKENYLLHKRILPLGLDRDLKLLTKAFGGKAKVLIAQTESQVIAGVLLLFHNQAAYYWQAAATSQGKKLLAPTLLVWEAIKLAKKLKCETFDFEGVYDERFPQNKSWLGFTHFKEGFRGEEVLYPFPLVSNRLLFL